MRNKHTAGGKKTAKWPEVTRLLTRLGKMPKMPEDEINRTDTKWGYRLMQYHPSNEGQFLLIFSPQYCPRLSSCYKVLQLPQGR